MKISLVIPFIDTADVVEHCVELALQNAERDDTEFIFIDNGSRDEGLVHQLTASILESGYEAHYLRHRTNEGVLDTFRQGMHLAGGDIIAYIHSDVLLQEFGWDQRIHDAFVDDPKLGLAGLFGARALHPNGGREYCMSNMRGAEWGKCDCHNPAAYHHGDLMQGVAPAAMFDGVGLFFRREVLVQLDAGDMFADWRAPHHFYDRIIGCKVADLGWHMAVIGIGFDHWSGATANSSPVYRESAEAWLIERGMTPSESPDNDIYNLAEHQFFAEFRERLPLRVDAGYNYRWFR